MKLLVISAAFPPMRAGEADHALQLCWQLADRGHDVHVLTTKGCLNPEGANFSVHAIMSGWRWSDLPRFMRFLARCSPDGVILMYIGFIYNDHPMMTFAPTVSKIILPSVPFVTQFENAEGASAHETSFGARCVRKAAALCVGANRVDYRFGTLLSDSDRLIVLSGVHLAQLAKLAPGLERKSVLVPPPPLMRISPDDSGLIRARGRKLLKVEPEDVVIVYLGRIYPPKGIETLLRAFHSVLSKRRNVHLVFLGGAHDRPDSEHFRASYPGEMAQLASDLGIAKMVTWTGEFDWDSELPSLYLRASDLCVLPYNYGVMLNNSSFAMTASYGLPIITTKGGILEAPFVHEENVYLCAPKKPDELAMAIEVLIDQPHFRKRLADGALRLAKEWFSWERAIERTIETVAS
jgi:polysaccharide biosynthesis protein PslF